MGVDRYNMQKQRLKKLLKMYKDPSVEINSKQHKEMHILKSAHKMVEENYSMETMQKIIKHIEDLDELDRATSSDIARLLVLKDKVLNNK
tara:strand:- start:764 stop:1033 length:270 start_codon:yes stop_codon:yes gene_type:complete